jgi:hypothetical protein
MPMIELSNKDVRRGTLIDTGWYIVRIEEIGEGAPSSKGDSINYLVDGTILANAENPSDDTFKDFPTPYWNFNSKAMGFVVGFLKALKVDVKPGRLELGAAKGKTLKVFIEQGEYNGRLNNRIEHKYAPVE